MKTAFPGFFANKPEDISKLWQDCLIVLDANVLLSLYRFSDATRLELLKVFQSLKARLWIPHQVASEYLTNRFGVLGDQLKAYDDAAKKVEALQKSLENLNQAPFVSEGTQRQASDLFSKLTTEFAKKRSVHERRVYNDDIKDALEALFDGRVGKAYEREQIEEYIKSGAERYAENIPPGFEDKKKGGDSALFSERCRPYGDYFVWLQMLEKAKQDNVSIIFVTGDVKDDWWSSFQGKTVGPLPGLVEEFQMLTGKNFYMYTPHRFLERANEHLEQVVSQVAVDEIKNSERIDEDRYHRGGTPANIVKPQARQVGALEAIMLERRELINRADRLESKQLKTKMHILEIVDFRDGYTHGSDPEKVTALDEELHILERQYSVQQSELEYTKIMIAECTRRLTEVKSVSEGGKS